MIEDIDIRVCFQDPADEAGFCYKDDEASEKGEDEGNIETFHSQILRFLRERVSVLPGSEQAGN